MQEGEKWKWSRSVVSDPQRPHGLQPSRLLRPWDFPGKSTVVGQHKETNYCNIIFAIVKEKIKCHRFKKKLLCQFLSNMDAFIIQNRIVMHFFCLLKASVHSLEGQCMHAKSLHSCPTLCDPMDCSPPGSSVHEVLQARILEWVPMPSFRESSRPRDQTCVSYIPCTGRQVFFVLFCFLFFYH